MMNRRHWMAAAVGSFSALTVLQAKAYALGAEATADGRLLVVFLRGAMDGLFAFSPTADAQLATLRPSLAKAAMERGIALGQTGFSAHPACAPLAQLFASGDLAFAPCAGTTDASRSHFQAQDLFELGSGATHGDTGFMARAAQLLGSTRGAISFTQGIPLSFQNNNEDLGLEVAPLVGSGLKLPQGRVLAAIRQAHQGQGTGQALEQAIATQADIETAMSQPMMGGMDAGASRGAPMAKGFARQAEQMGRMLRANNRLSLAFLDLGGWDTHAGEEGILSRSLGDLSQGLVALKDSLGDQEWRRTRVVVMTEFGRTVRENGTHGTDHGHGGLALLLGGNIHGGRMLGHFEGLADQHLNQARDLPVNVDWRSLLAACLRESHGFNEAQLNEVFPGLPRQTLKV